MIQETLRKMAAAHGETPAAILKRLAVCRDGFTIEAARAIAGLKNNGALDSVLETLQKWELIQLTEGRYRIDPQVIEAVGEDEDAHLPHYEFYLALMHKHSDTRDHAGLVPEAANMEAAFEWAMRTEQFEDAFWFCYAVSYFLVNQGKSAQQMNWLERVAAELLPSDKTDGSSDPDLIGAVHNSLGLAYRNQQSGNRIANLRRAVAAYESALIYHRPDEVPMAYAMTQFYLGRTYRDIAELENPLDNLRKSIAALGEALIHWTPVTNPQFYPLAQNALGMAYRRLAGLEDRANNLRRAAAALKKAFPWKPKTLLLEYARAQNNLVDDHSKGMR